MTKKGVVLLLLAAVLVSPVLLFGGGRQEGAGQPAEAQKAAAPAAENVAVINGMPVILADPALAMDWYDTQAVYNLYSPLIYPAPDGTLRPHLAEKWEAVDGKMDHWRFTLRQGVKFHDGSELTAEDVAFSMQRLLAIGKGYSGTVGKVTAQVVSKYVVDLILDKPNAIFPNTLTLFWPLSKKLVLENKAAGDYGEFGDYGQQWLADHDAGTGPYTMISHKPGERLDAGRYRDYFLGWEDWGQNQVPIEKLIFIMNSETSTLMMMLNSKQLDLEANGGFSRKTLQEILNTKSLKLHPIWSQDWTIWLNTAKPPTDDVHFRRALQYAFNYDAIMNEYKPFGATEAGVYSSGLPGYVKIPPQPRKQDLEKARQELALSKYKPGDVTVVFHYCAGLEAEEEIGLQLQADLAKLGIKMEIAGPPWPQYSAECGAPDTTPNMTIFIFPVVYPSPDSFLFYMYHPDNIGGIYSAHWYKDAEIGALIDKARNTLDFDARTAIYVQLQQKISSLALALYPYEIPAQFTSQLYMIGPKEKFPIVGPTVNMHNWRIDLTKK
jgi:peptide/nickel transport system substrate-binding protein